MTESVFVQCDKDFTTNKLSPECGILRCDGTVYHHINIMMWANFLWLHYITVIPSIKIHKWNVQILYEPEWGIAVTRMWHCRHTSKCQTLVAVYSSWNLCHIAQTHFLSWLVGNKASKARKFGSGLHNRMIPNEMVMGTDQIK